MIAGDSLRVRVTVARGGAPVTDGAVVAEFYAPGRDPEVPDVRRSPDYRVACAYEAASRRWTCAVHTTAWAAGWWQVRGAVDGPDGAAGGPVTRFRLAA
jgi:hypothetical protein